MPRFRSTSVFSYRTLPNSTREQFGESGHLPAQIPEKFFRPQPFATHLGTNSTVRAYSNGDDATLANGHMVFAKESRNIPLGIFGQCVQYARTWLYRNFNVVFDDVDAAIDIWRLHSVKRPEIDLHKVPARFSFLSLVNGSYLPPQRGDLLIYAREFPHAPYGHVAVIVGVDPSQCMLYIAEQNNYNAVWQKRDNHARTIKYQIHNGRYVLRDEIEIVGLKRVDYTHPL